MNKEIAISIRPEWVEKILNGEKTIEIRKRFPKDFRGKVYIYVTKGKPYLVREDDDDEFALYYVDEKDINIKEFTKYYGNNNGKVVASFIVDDVEEIYVNWDKITETFTFETNKLDESELLQLSCLNKEQLENYLNDSGYAIHITNLEIFDKPKELSDFGIKKAPQSWMYVRGK